MPETNAQRLKRLRAQAVLEGRCSVCRLREPRDGLRVCDVCLGRSQDLAVTYKAQGLCACGNKLWRDYKSCKSCLESHRASTQRSVKKAKRKRACRTCRWRVPAPGLVTCDYCIDRINAAQTKRRAANANAGLCFCGSDRRPGYHMCWAHVLYFQLYRARNATGAKRG